MFVIGLTGGIASGKSTVAKILKEQGAVILDADKISKKVVEKGKPAYEEVINVFGKKVLKEDGELNRKMLADIVFNNSRDKKKLENIIHPRVEQYFYDKLNEYKDSDEIVVLDVPLLLESGMDKLADEVWVVYVSEEIQVKRIMMRDKSTAENALQRIKNQMSMDERIKYADRVINTEGAIGETRKKVLSIWNKIRSNDVPDNA